MLAIQSGIAKYHYLYAQGAVASQTPDGHFSTHPVELPEVLKLIISGIKRVNKMKSLGVIVDEKLNRDEHFIPI